MKIVSTNIGQVRTVEWRGLPVETGIYKKPVDEPLFLGQDDVLNDHVLDRRYHGGSDKACYLYSADHYSFWKEKFPPADWEWGMFGENLTVSGLDESEICIGDKFQIGQAIVQVSQPRQPCYKLGFRFNDQSVVEEFWNSAFPGIYVRVLHQGTVKAGDTLTLIDHAVDSLSVSQVFSIFTSGRNNSEMIQKALSEPFLAASCREDIRKMVSRNA